MVVGGERPGTSSDPSQNQTPHRATVEDVQPEPILEDPSGTGDHSQLQLELENVLGGGEHATDDLDRSISVRLSDPDVLDCFICYEPLSIPLFQCRNGHIACSTCCAKLRQNKCPMCTKRIGDIRCRALEKVLESIKISCQNAKYGCRETLSYSEKNDHRKKCFHAPCLCPHSGCSFVATSKELSHHFSREHAGSGIQFKYDHHFSVNLKRDEGAAVLQEQTDANLFILNSIAVPRLGNAVYISCIGPNSSKPGFFYDIAAKSLQMQGCYVQMQSFTNYVQARTVGIPSSTGFFVIPYAFYGPSQQLEVKICIWCEYDADAADANFPAEYFFHRTFMGNGN